MSSIVKRGDAYRIFVSLGSDENGRPVRKTVTFHPPKGLKGKKELLSVQNFAQEFEDSCRSKYDLNTESRFSDICEWYFGNIAPLKLKENTLSKQKDLMKNYVLPALGKYRVREVNTVRIDALISKLTQSGGLKNGRPLSPGTVNLIRTVLGTVFETALKAGMIKENPVKNAIKPRNESKEREFLDSMGCRKLLKALPNIKNLQIQRAITVLLFTGMRRGELLALHWEDVDFKHNTISIKYTLVRINGVSKLTTPKTEASVRTIKVPSEVTAVLKEQKEFVNGLKKKKKKKWEKTGACFVSLNGGYMNGEFLNNTFREFLKVNGFPKLRLHDLRHENASILINRGVPIKIVADHLGHKSERTTESFYTHLFYNSKRLTADAISKALSQ